MGIKKADLQPLLALTLGAIDVTPLETVSYTHLTLPTNREV